MRKLTTGGPLEVREALEAYREAETAGVDAMTAWEAEGGPLSGPGWHRMRRTAEAVERAGARLADRLDRFGLTLADGDGVRVEAAEERAERIAGADRLRRRMLAHRADWIAADMGEAQG